MRCKPHPTPIPLPTSQWRKTKPLLLSCYLYGSPKLLIAEAAHECPPTAGDVRHLCDGLHLLRAANAYLESQNSKWVRKVQNPNPDVRAHPPATPAPQSIKTHLGIPTASQCLRQTPVFL